MALRWSVSCVLFLMTACGVPEEAPVDSERSSTRSDELYGWLSHTEFAFDAPWRLEPDLRCVEGSLTKGGETSTVCHAQYDAVPLHLIFRDYVGVTELTNNTVLSVEIDEVGSGLPPVTVGLSGFHEIEKTQGLWYQESWATQPPHTVCRRWAGETCSGFAVLDGNSEWDGTLFYRLRQFTAPGRLVELKLTAVVSAMQWNPTASYPVTKRYSNTVYVQLGDPLPRFDGRWVYGDLHYHSQGTDNEGESGYSHRTTLHAMAALGLDFTFATEHASNSGQFDDYSDVVWRSDRILRDMNQKRWNALNQALWSADGANEQVVSKPRRFGSGQLSVPQLFLGGEVDVIPELAQDDLNFGVFFGSGQRYQWGRACYEYPAASELTVLGVSWLQACPNGTGDLIDPAFDTVTRALVPGRHFLKDVQGPLQLRYGRQHLLHLPRGQAAPEFVASDTTTFGGASRRLASLLRDEYGPYSNGVTFLAHPVAYATGSGAGRLGPDIVPYSRAQLQDAFRNRAVLGLQLWNEDIRLRTSLSNPGALKPTNPEGEWAEVNRSPLFESIFEGLATFDRMLMWSVDTRETSQVAGLPAGQIRKVFLAGGSDAHGDLNYARKGYAFGLDGVSDLAMGKPRNLVMVPSRTGRVLSGGGLSAQALSSTDVVNALSTGQFVVTDGPLVRLAVDANGNGRIDDGDVPMGGDVSWNEAFPSLRLVVEWQSTPEFGRVRQIDLTANAFTDSTGLGVTYNPYQAGVRGADQPIGWPRTTYTASSGETFYQLDDKTYLDPSGALRVVVPYAEGYGGRRVITLNPTVFLTAAFDLVTVPCTTAKISDTSEGGSGGGVCREPRVSKVRPPSALVVRAVGKTNGPGDINPATGQLYCETDYRAYKQGRCEPRLVLTNPIWARQAPDRLGTVSF